MMKIEVGALALSEPFRSLFPVEPEVVAALTADMRANGFDAVRSIIAWKAPDGRPIVVDGHMRLEAAKAAKLKQVDVTVRQFADEDAAFAFAVASQRDRRNLTKLEIAEAIARAELARADKDLATPARSLGPPKGQKGGGGSTKDPVKQAVVTKAATAGVGTRTAEQALANVRATGDAANPKRNGAASKSRRKAIPTATTDEAFEDVAAELRLELKLKPADVLALLRMLKRLRRSYGADVVRLAVARALQLLELAGDRDPVALYQQEAAPLSDAETAKALRELGGDLATALTPTSRRRKSK
jgi:ParB-like chromosome segregation protein Spo0J